MPHPLIHTAYAAFNARDIDTALTTMRPDVRWPKAFEGDFVTGHNEIRDYRIPTGRICSSVLL